MYICVWYRLIWVFERSRRPLIAKASFEPGPVRVRFVAEEVALEHGFLQVLRSPPPVSIIPPMLYTPFHLHTTQFRRTSGQSVRSLKQSSALWDIWGAVDRKVSSQYFSLNMVKISFTLLYRCGTYSLRSSCVVYTAVVLLLVAWRWQDTPKLAIQNEPNTDLIYDWISSPIPSCPIFSTVLIHTYNYVILDICGACIGLS
jgi:hypothetical protein